MILELETISIIIYLINIALSLSIAIIIINKLYISKKFSKEEDFHHYNDLFSWEIFFIFIGIENVVKIISTIITLNTEISNLLLKIRILIIFFPFWFKIVHLEKIMDKITYEKHGLAVIIPFAIVLILFFTNLPTVILILVFLGTTLIPFLILTLFLKNTGSTRKTTFKVFAGSVFIGLGLILRPEILIEYKIISKIFDLLIDLSNITAPSFLIIGTILIYDSLRREL